MAFMLVASAGQSHAALVDARIDWKSVASQHFIIHYQKGSLNLAEKTARFAEAIHTKLTPVINWVPRSRTHIVLFEEFDITNGWATPIPRNQIGIYMAPPSEVNGLEDFDDWLYRVLLHEYVHILHLDKAGRSPEGLRNFVGRTPLYFIAFTPFPNLFTPRWLKEGLATYIETDYKTGVGRGQSSYYRALLRMETKNGLKSLRELNQDLVSWPSGTAWYLYGAYFHDFLVRKYGEIALNGFLENISSQLIPFLMNSALYRRIGKDFYDVWEEFVLDTEVRFTKELNTINKEGVVEGVALSHDGYGSGRLHSDEQGGVYYMVSDAEDTPKLVYKSSPDAKKEFVVAKVYDTSFDYHPTQGILRTEFNVDYNVNYYFDLFQLNPKTGRETKLTYNGRFIQARWSNKGDKIVAVRIQNGVQQLVLLNNQGEELEVLEKGADNVMFNGVNFSPNDQTLIASVFRSKAGWNIEQFDLAKRRWQAITQTEAIETDVEFVPNSSDEIVFSADYDGVYNIYQLNLKTKKLIKLSNVLGGAFAPQISANRKTLYYRGLHENGYDVYALSLADTKKINSPRFGQLQGYTLKMGFNNPPAVEVSDFKYNALRYMKPNFWMPYFLLDNVRSEIGLQTGAEDPLGYHTLYGTLSYDAKNSLPAWTVNYSYNRYRPIFNFMSLRLYSYEPPGSSTLIAIGAEDITSFSTIYPFFKRSWQFAMFAGVTNRAFGVAYEAPGWRLTIPEDELLLGGGFQFANTKNTLRAVTPIRGINWTAFADYKEGNLQTATASSAKAAYSDMHLYSPPMRHTTLSIRLAAGMSQMAASPFKLGGERSPIAELPGIGKRDFTLRGYPQGKFQGNRFGLTTLEWSFPLAKPETSIMMPPIGLSRVNGSLFVDAGKAWYSNTSEPNAYSSYGAELTLETLWGYLLPLDIKVGYANGVDEFGEEQYYISTRAIF